MAGRLIRCISIHIKLRDNQNCLSIKSIREATRAEYTPMDIYML